jgi:hypothetical protein
MDGQRFDRWARAFAAASSRRGLIKGLAGTLVAGLVAADIEETEAANSCQRCDKKGRCVPKTDGTLCGQCGVCAGGQCVAGNAARCGPCKKCNTSTFHCDAQTNGTACGDCGSCKGGECQRRKERCSKCATCKQGTDRTYSCQSQCTECETCENGQCVAKDDGTSCGANGLCCQGVCQSGVQCCTDAECGECSRCDDGQCNGAIVEGKSCQNSDCKECRNRQCVQRTDNHTCLNGRPGVCCHGECCQGNNPTCCGGTCCTVLLCFGDVCCLPGSGFTAAGADLCCPFGPPCGEGNAARCCNEDQECCQGECKQLGECCPDENVCGDRCCTEGQTCCNGTCCDGPCDEAGDDCCPRLQSCDDVCCDDGAECCGGTCCAENELCCGTECCSTTCTGPGLTVCCPDEFFCVRSPFPDPNQHTVICCDEAFPICCDDGFCGPPCAN